MLNGERENVLNVADDARDVRDDVLRKQDAVERARAHAHAQRFRIETTIQSEQSANAYKREAEAQLNRHELRRHKDEQREPRRAVRQFRVDYADGFERDDVLERQLKRASVFALCGIDGQEAASFDDARIEREPDAFWWNKIEVEIGHAEPTAAIRRKRNRRIRADAIERRNNRAEMRGDLRRKADVQCGITADA